MTSVFTDNFGEIDQDLPSNISLVQYSLRTDKIVHYLPGIAIIVSIYLDNRIKKQSKDSAEW